MLSNTFNLYPDNNEFEKNSEFYEKELSKKLKLSNKEQKENSNYFVFKTKKNNADKVDLVINNFGIEKETEKSINLNPKLELNNIIPDNVKNNNPNPIPTKQKVKLKRISELEQNNLYFILGLDENTEKENIKKAYKNLCRLYHPDKGGDPDNFNKINRAYNILYNDLTRKLYNKFSFQAMELIDYILTLENQNELDFDFDIFNTTDGCDLEVFKLLIYGKK